MIFQTDDLTRGWDGTHEFLFAPADVYVYTLEYQDMEDNIHRRSGNVTLLR